MSQILTDNDDNRSVAASDFVQLDQADEVPDQQEEQPQFGGFQKNPVDWTMETGSTHNNYENGLKEMKWMMANLQATIQTLQEKMKNLELEAKIRAMEEKAEQNAKYQALEAKMNEVMQMLSTQKEEQRKEMAQLKDGFAKEMAQLKDGFAKEMAQLKDGFAKEMAQLKDGFAKEMAQLKDGFAKEMAQLKDGFAKEMEQLESKNQKLEEKVMSNVEVRTTKNGLEEQQKMEKFREEVDKNGQQAIGSNLSKSKILANLKGIVWDASKSEVGISECGLELKTTSTHNGWVFATEGYIISGEHGENFQFPGPIVFYYEVTITSNRYWYVSIGFTYGIKPAAGRIGGSPNSYGIVGYGSNNNDSLWLAGKKHELECPTGVIDGGDVLGCGLLLNSKNELAVFFTINGILCGKQIPINPTVDRLYPTAYLNDVSVEANFGNNLVDKPFKFDIDKCPGLVFE